MSWPVRRRALVKTAGFTLPLLQRLSAQKPANGYRPVRALVLTPTRELAAQVGESVCNLWQILAYAVCSYFWWRLKSIHR